MDYKDSIEQTYSTVDTILVYRTDTIFIERLSPTKVTTITKTIEVPVYITETRIDTIKVTTEDTCCWERDYTHTLSDSLLTLSTSVNVYGTLNNLQTIYTLRERHISTTVYTPKEVTRRHLYLQGTMGGNLSTVESFDVGVGFNYLTKIKTAVGVNYFPFSKSLQVQAGYRIF